MMKTDGKISTELVSGIFLLTFCSIFISFISTIKIIEKQRIEIESFNIQRIFYQIETASGAPINDFQFFLPSGLSYAVYDPGKKEIISGIDLLKADNISFSDLEISVEKGIFYPSILTKKTININNYPYLIVIKKDFDAEKNRIKDLFFWFLPFGLISLFTLTGFTYAYYRRRFLLPFHNLKKAYSQVSEDNLNVYVENTNVKEWDLVFSHFNDMMDRLKNYKINLEKNIEELYKANEALKSVQNEIIFSEKMATVGRLSAGLAHEIGNPLTSIMGYISYLKETAQKEEEREILTLIYRETERINRIIKDLLNFARSKPEDSISVCNSYDIVNDVIRLLNPQKDFKKVELINNISEGVAVVFSGEELKQVLLNIMINAVDVSPEGGKIILDAEKTDSYYIISVKDEGGGVPEEIKDKIFDPFFTTKPVGKGTGLGLSVVHSLVNRYGGRVYFENHEKGSIFYIQLRIFKEDQ